LSSSSVQLRVGFLGVGSVARYHAEVLGEMGHVIAAGCGKSADSPRWSNFRSVATEARFQPDGQALLSDPNIDAVVACLPWNLSESWLPDLLASPKQVLLEKPIALCSQAISDAMGQSQGTLQNKYVGFNRRFYRTVQTLKERIEEGGIKNVEITITETVAGLASTFGEEIIDHILAYSSCHTLDTAIHILGALQPIHMYGRQDSGYPRPFRSISGVLETKQGAPVFLTIMADNPAPMGIRVYFDDQTTWHLSPLEHLVAYKGYEIVEPTGDIKIRRYIPKPFLEINEDAEFKPGFVAQMQAFVGDKEQTVAATVQESLALLRFTEKIQRMAGASESDTNMAGETGFRRDDASGGDS